MSKKLEKEIIIFEDQINGIKVRDYIKIKNSLMNKILISIDKLTLKELLNFIEKLAIMNPELKINLSDVRKILRSKSNKNNLIPANEKIEEYEYNEQNALFFIDTLNHEVAITSNFFKLFSIEHKDYTFTSLVRSIFKNIERGLEVLRILRKDIIINQEYMETVYLKNKRKLEITYRVYEISEYKGILFNIRNVDSSIPFVNYDNLTGTLNRDIILEKLEDITEYSQEKDIAVLLINLNDFKNVNTLFGYKLGDFAIKTISERIEFTIRKNDIFGRINGDEFILILTKYKHRKNIETITRRIVKIIEEPIEIANKSYKITTSIGVCIFDEQNKTASKLISSANLALFKAKERGKGAYEIFSTALHTTYMKKLNMENELKKAIINDEFEVHYQPQFDIINNRIIGLEALVRWNHPNKGMISPAEFIPLAERNGDIIPLGKLILKKAIIETKDFLKIYDLKLSVNFSGKQFDDPEMVSIISKIITETEQASKYLELEITETTAMYNLEINIEKMKELRHLNFGLAIDDFGSGYSSLTYLRKFPINKLKIDREFIVNIVHDIELQSIVKSIVDIGRSLKLQVVMEGVETEKELSVLRKLGCSIFQGYYFERPINIEQLKLKFESNKYDFKYLK